MTEISKTYPNFTEAITKLDLETDLEAQKWVREKKRVGTFSVLSKMVSRFWQVYFLDKGRKEGVPGLFRAVNAGMYEFLSYAKYWELEKMNTKSDPERSESPKTFTGAL